VVGLYVVVWGERDRRDRDALLNFPATPGTPRDVLRRDCHGRATAFEKIEVIHGCSSRHRRDFRRVAASVGVFVMVWGVAVPAIAAFQGLARCDDLGPCRSTEQQPRNPQLRFG
jgi:hypothetical protein